MGELPFERRQQTVKQREESVTDPKFGKDPEKRTIPELLERGIVIIDKPAGPTSHQVADYVKKILKLDKAGHSGTLDPGVTGVLPVALGKGTRIVQSLLSAGKEYICLMHLHGDISDEHLAAIFEKFTGKIKQLPPIKSAVKRQWRFRKIYYLELIERQGREVLFRVGCQAGTYIRKLCTDMGAVAGCGAHMAELRRTKAAGFTEEQAVTLQDLVDAFHYYNEGDDTPLKKALLPLEAGAVHLHKIWVHDSAINPLCHGMQLKLPGIAKLDNDMPRDEWVAVFSLKDELILTGSTLLSSKEMMQKKGIAVKTQQVFMPSGTYPRQ